VLIDTDSFQVRDPASGVVFRCPVGRPEFTPPELREHRFAEVDRAPEHDRFGLGVLVFQMLMEGTHPFAGRWRGEGEPPAVQERIAAGHFPYAGLPGVPLEPARTAPPLEVLDPGLRALLVRCFVNGHPDPAARPHAAEWRDALAAAEKALVACERNEQHRFGGHLDACPWCERARRLEGRDPFPSVQTVQRGEHRPRGVPARAPRHQAPTPAPRRRFQAVGQAGQLPGPLPAALFVAAVMVAFVGLVSLTIPPLLIALLAGGLVFAAKRMTQPGSFAQWATALTMFLVAIGFATSGGPASGPPGTHGPARFRHAGEMEPISYAPFAFDIDAVDRKPVPENLDSVAAALSTIRNVSRGPSGSSVIEFVVDQDGLVDPATVATDPASDSLLLEPLRETLFALRFQPAVRGSRPVRAQVRLMVHLNGGRVEPAFDVASWIPGLTFMSNFAGPGWQEPTGQDNDPVLENADEVEELLDRTYPPERRRQGFEGVVTVRFRIDATGAVDPGSIVVVHTNDDAFAASAAKVAARMRYYPASAGRPVPAYVTELLMWDLYS
ncbi:MAG TPA: TonB family protein, partial [Longimicrobiaceae bacterium]|nr:TonB family protein [Longimicrobiaceae bacterium]